MTQAEKLDQGRERLRVLIEQMGTLSVAFSGGVDSSCLLAFAARCAPGRVVGLHVETELLHPTDREAREVFHQRLPGIEIERLQHAALAVPAVRANARDRCYHCKKAIFTRLLRRVEEGGLGPLCEGSHVDDLDEHRPGHRALEELGIRSPFVEAGLGKAEVRALARELGLAVAERPATACLATRVPYDTPLERERLERIGAAEAALLARGYTPLRLRDHGDVARLEFSVAQQARALEEREQLVSLVRGYGWQHVTLDLAGFRSGSFDEGVKDAG